MNHITTIIVMIAACLIIYRLFTVLGRKTGDEEQRAREMRQTIEARRRLAEQMDGQDQQDDPDDIYAQAEKRQSQLANNQALASLFDADPDFDLDQFIRGAQSAYEMVLVAFAAGDSKTLKKLLSNEVYQQFKEAIDERKAQNIKADLEIIGIKSADIIETSVEGKQASVVVKFVTELVSTSTDAKGEVIEGDPNYIDTVTDIWTFTRKLDSRDPNWLLSATEDDDDK